ncbi:hypothetical protein BJ508DRAFT_315831 [Ascobolus immersus RN42]|uniref:Uncharacterized protein n=1 Tax=Ascobolus immersus RN42 TaxID=1160509 RepID=A0A3N4H929_ASCIM|nr:hypothetical protein BJ508DRAFT_315831 [Ascobolus immersus RN42]
MFTTRIRVKCQESMPASSKRKTAKPTPSARTPKATATAPLKRPATPTESTQEKRSTRSRKLAIEMPQPSAHRAHPIFDNDALSILHSSTTPPKGLAKRLRKQADIDDLDDDAVSPEHEVNRPWFINPLVKDLISSDDEDDEVEDDGRYRDTATHPDTLIISKEKCTNVDAEEKVEDEVEEEEEISSPAINGGRHSFGSSPPLLSSPTLRPHLSSKGRQVDLMDSQFESKILPQDDDVDMAMVSPSPPSSSKEDQSSAAEVEDYGYGQATHLEEDEQSPSEKEDQSSSAEEENYEKSPPLEGDDHDQVSGEEPDSGGSEEMAERIHVAPAVDYCEYENDEQVQIIFEKKALDMMNVEDFDEAMSISKSSKKKKAIPANFPSSSPAKISRLYDLGQNSQMKKVDAFRTSDNKVHSVLTSMRSNMSTTSFTMSAAMLVRKQTKILQHMKELFDTIKDELASYARFINLFLSKNELYEEAKKFSFETDVDPDLAEPLINAELMRHANYLLAQHHYGIDKDHLTAGRHGGRYNTIIHSFFVPFLRTLFFLSEQAFFLFCILAAANCVHQWLQGKLVPNLSLQGIGSALKQAIIYKYNLHQFRKWEEEKYADFRATLRDSLIAELGKSPIVSDSYGSDDSVEDEYITEQNRPCLQRKVSSPLKVKTPPKKQSSAKQGPATPTPKPKPRSR